MNSESSRCSRPTVTINHEKPQRKLNLLPPGITFSCRTHKSHLLKLFRILVGVYQHLLTEFCSCKMKVLWCVLLERGSAAPASALASPRCPSASSDLHGRVTLRFSKGMQGFWVLSISSFWGFPLFLGTTYGRAERLQFSCPFQPPYGALLW